MRTLYGQRLNTERHLSLSPCATIVVGFTLFRNICVNDRTVQSLANSKPLLVYFRSRFDENVIGFCANSTRLRLSNESARRRRGRRLRREHVVLLTSLRPALLPVLISLVTAGAAYGQAKPTGGPTASPVGAMVYFVDIKDGVTIAPKSIIHFGMRGMGLSPAGVDRPNSGHHHLLIDTELPPLSEPIPSDFNHLHFGNGQTEAELNLPPGEHTLQLLLGDSNHVPHSPPVMSERIRIRVAEGAAAPSAAAGAPSAPTSPGGRHASAPNAKVYFAYPNDGDYVSTKPVIRFGLIGMGVAPAGIEKANTGHHHLMVDEKLPPFDEPIPTDFNHLHFGAGQTEAQITLPPGRHTLQLLLGDENHMPHDPPVFSKQITVVVTESGRRVAESGRRVAEVDSRPAPKVRKKKHRKRWVYYE
jgi:hypothetical protein